jgi:thioredoxin-dependent peroxiredoxin
VVLGASFDPPEDNRRFAEDQGFPFRLLSDVGRSVGAMYEVVREPDDPYVDYARRLAYLIDPDGVIHRSYDVTDVAGHADQVVADLEAAQHSR